MGCCDDPGTAAAATADDEVMRGSSSSDDSSSGNSSEADTELSTIMRHELEPSPTLPGRGEVAVRRRSARSRSPSPRGLQYLAAAAVPRKRARTTLQFVQCDQCEKWRKRDEAWADDKPYSRAFERDSCDVPCECHFGAGALCPLCIK